MYERYPINEVEEEEESLSRDESNCLAIENSIQLSFNSIPLNKSSLLFL